MYLGVNKVNGFSLKEQFFIVLATLSRNMEIA
jgi:hypothetical protein